MKNLKIEKKHWIGSCALTAVALIAFVAGTRTPARMEKDLKSHGEMKVAVAKPAHEPDEGAGVAHSPERHPASAPNVETPEDVEPYQEEDEVETQIAHTAPGKHSAPEKHSAPKHEAAQSTEHVASEHHDEVHESDSAPIPKPDSRGLVSKILGTYGDAWENIQAKIESIHHAEEDNRRLRLENAYLRVMVETGKFNIRSEESKKKTETVGKKLATEAGSKAARSVASIRYQYPENLLPEQLLALGVSYFKSRDDEKAAVILNFLTGLEDEPQFKTASNYLMAGVVFYRLENFKYASDYFERIRKISETDESTMKAKRQAVYWEALIAERQKNRALAQKLILENLEKDPLTKEAHWVNPQKISTKTRTPASMPASVTETEESHEGPSHSHH